MSVTNRKSACVAVKVSAQLVDHKHFFRSAIDDLTGICRSMAEQEAQALIDRGWWNPVTQLYCTVPPSYFASEEINAAWYDHCNEVFYLSKKLWAKLMCSRHDASFHSGTEAERSAILEEIMAMSDFSPLTLQEEQWAYELDMSEAEDIFRSNSVSE